MKLILSAMAVAVLGTAAVAQEQITIVGCVEREADYRRVEALGRGGFAGTGLGVGNEYILGNASVSIGTAAMTGPGTSTAAAATATGIAYELVGRNEGHADQFLGRRVEIHGKVSGPSRTALNLRELEVSTIRGAAGACPVQ